MKGTAIHGQADRQTAYYYGIDLLRLSSMFLVITLHVLGRGGILSNAKGLNYSLAWLLETIAYCAVDCFGLVSGFVGYREQEKPYHYKKYGLFWLQAFFYNFGITLIFYLLHLPSQNPVTLKELIKSALPVSYGYYWYFRAYTGLFFVIPWLNKMLRHLSKKECTLLVVTLFLLAVIGSYKDTLTLNDGQSFAWLVFLYIFGAWINISKLYEKLKPGRWLMLLLGCVMVGWLWKISSPIARNFFTSYTSITVLTSAICSVCLFSRLSFKAKTQKLIRFLAPCAFSVYLLQVHYIIWDNYFNNAFVWIAFSNPLLLIPLVLGCSLGLVAVFLSIDLLRKRLFELLQVDCAIDKIASLFKKRWNMD